MPRWRGTRPGKGRRAKWKLAATIVAAFIVAFAAYSYAETYRLEVKEYQYSGQDTPEAFDGVRIVLLADVHRAFYFTQGRLESIVAQVNALHPDLVLLGGDYVYGSRDYEADAFMAFADLEAPLGVYAVPGNHDYEELDHDVYDLSSTVKAAADAGIPLLDNSGMWITKDGERIRVAGVSDLRHGRPDAAPALAGAAKDDFVVLLSHEPDFAEQLAPGAVDLVLSGHLHGGQLSFFGLWSPIVDSLYGRKYITGVVTNDDTQVIVSNGVGTTFVPLRFFARAQIVMVTLHATK